MKIPYVDHLLLKQSFLYFIRFHSTAASFHASFHSNYPSYKLPHPCRHTLSIIDDIIILYLLFDKDIKFWLQICKLLPSSLWMNHFSIHFWMSRKVGNESVLMRSNYTIIGRVQRSREARSLAWQSE